MQILTCGGYYYYTIQYNTTKCDTLLFNTIQYTPCRLAMAVRRKGSGRTSLALDQPQTGRCGRNGFVCRRYSSLVSNTHREHRHTARAHILERWKMLQMKQHALPTHNSLTCFQLTSGVCPHFHRARTHVASAIECEHCGVRNWVTTNFNRPASDNHPALFPRCRGCDRS